MCQDPCVCVMSQFSFLKTIFIFLFPHLKYSHLGLFFMVTLHEHIDSLSDKYVRSCITLGQLCRTGCQG